MAKIDALYRVVEKNRLRRVDPAYQFPEGYLTIDEAIKRSMRMIVEKCGMKGYSAENWMSTLFVSTLPIAPIINAGPDTSQEEGKTASEGQAASEYETASEGENGFATEDRTRRHRNSD